MNPMKIAMLGSGNVGGALAEALAGAGHKVVLAARDTGSESVTKALARHDALKATPVAEAVASAEVVFLVTPFGANEAAIQSAGDLSGKVLVDCTNPVAPDLSHGLKNEISGGEMVQRLAPGAKVVKAFTIYGYENFDDSAYPGYGDVKPAMFIAGNDAGAKEAVGGLCEQMGWQAVDVGDIACSLHLEHMTLMWIKMARVQGRGAGIVWAMLER